MDGRKGDLAGAYFGEHKPYDCLVHRVRKPMEQLIATLTVEDALKNYGEIGPSRVLGHPREVFPGACWCRGGTTARRDEVDEGACDRGGPPERAGNFDAIGYGVQCAPNDCCISVVQAADEMVSIAFA